MTPDEVPLSRVEDQGYIFYHKGALSMFALQKSIGEEQVNQAIAQCTQTYSGFLVNTSHLINCFRAQAPDSVQQKISDLFETVIVYDNSLNHAHYRQLDKNTYELNMEIEAHKYSKDKPGTELPFQEWIRIEIETAKGPETTNKAHQLGPRSRQRSVWFPTFAEATVGRSGVACFKFLAVY